MCDTHSIAQAHTISQLLTILSVKYSVHGIILDTKTAKTLVQSVQILKF